MKALLIVLTVIIAGCAAKGNMPQKASYVCPGDNGFNVVYSENTVLLQDYADRVFNLKMQKSEQGMLYTDGNVSLQRNKDEIIVELIKGKPIKCREWKGM